MQTNKSSNNITCKGFQESVASLLQSSSLLSALCFPHSSQVGSKMKLLNQRLGSTPGSQAQALKGPLCPLQSLMGTADSRCETAFQAYLYQSNSPLELQKSSLERLQPPGCAGDRGLGGAHRTSSCQTFPSRSQLALKQHQPPSACRTSSTPLSMYGKSKISVRRRN